MFEKYKSIYAAKPNYIKIPVNHFDLNEKGVAEFNEVLRKFCELKKIHNYKSLVRTKSKGISTAWGVNQGYCYDVNVTKTMVELTFSCLEGWFRFQLRSVDFRKEKQMPGRIAFSTFKKTCKKFNVDLEELAIENGFEVKQQIVSPPVQIAKGAQVDKVYENVHHLDGNSSFNSGMTLAFPQLREPIKYLYDRRKIDKNCKSVLTETQGFMQSELVDYRFAHISKAGIDYNNKLVADLAEKLKKSGRKLLLFNTDGIWYQGDLYHDENEGEDLCQWKNDHKNCTLRIKSKGAYEFIEEGKYNVVLRGRCKLDRIKLREEWSWGDIYREDAKPMKFEFISLEEGVRIWEE